MGKRKSKHILVYILGASTLIIMFSILNSCLGNPISKIMCEKKVTEYVAEKYPYLNLIQEKPVYDFKLCRYVVKVYDNDSKDTSFIVYTDKLGNIAGDNYQLEVVDRQSTLKRLYAEFREDAKEIIEEKLDYDFQYASFVFSNELTEADMIDNLNLDMSVDIYNPPMPLKVQAAIYTTEVSWDKVAELGRDVKRVLDSSNINVESMDLTLIPAENKESGSTEGKLYLLDFYSRYIEECTDLAGDMQLDGEINSKNYEMRKELEYEQYGREGIDRF